MALYAISDLHLSLGTDKPMDIFGANWENYEQKLRQNWISMVQPEDIVILNGDNSWATYLENAVEDFTFIHGLPGTKLLSKGNHDYWWTTMAKQVTFCREYGFDSIAFLHNNHMMYGDVAICGTRGWQLTKNDAEDQKIYKREQERLRLSLQTAQKQNPKQIIVALHYPPDKVFQEILEQHPVTHCVYGHLHGRSFANVINTTTNGIEYQLVSCDYLNFVPHKIMD